MPEERAHAGNDAAQRDSDAQVRGERRGQISIYTCPECAGSLWQVDEAGLIRFRCHAGHVLSGEELLRAQSDVLEFSLWQALRVLADRTNLARQLAAEARRQGAEDSAESFGTKIRAWEREERSLRQLLEFGQTAGRENPDIPLHFPDG